MTKQTDQEGEGQHLLPNSSLAILIGGPVVCGVAIFLAATRLAGLPEKNWALISTALVLLALGIILRALSNAGLLGRPPRRSSDSSPGSWRPLRISMGGLVLIVWGGWITAMEDAGRGLIMVGGGVTVILIAAALRKWVLRRSSASANSN